MNKIRIEHRVSERDVTTWGQFKMWRGKCTCGHEWQFHFFGASLGYGLEHLRRDWYRMHEMQEKVA